MKREDNSNAHKDRETLKLEGRRGERRIVVRAQASCVCTEHKTVWTTNVFGEKSQTLLGFTFHNKSPFLLLQRVSRAFRDSMSLPMSLSQLLKKHAAKCWHGQAYLPKLPSPAYAVTTTYDTMGCHQRRVWIMEQPEAISDAIPSDITCCDWHMPNKWAGEDHGTAWVAKQNFCVCSAGKAYRGGIAVEVSGLLPQPTFFTQN